MSIDSSPPDGSTKAGYAALADELGLAAPVRSRMAVAGHRIKEDVQVEGWVLADNRIKAPVTPVEHLEFAIRRENIDLLMLKKAFQAIGRKDMEGYVRSSPTAILQRKSWFLYEWLTGDTLDLPDSKRSPIEILDPSLYHVSSKGSVSQRHRVIDNLPGTPAFCAIARKTDPMSAMTDEALNQRVGKVMSSASADVTRRATAHLVLGESRSSFAIEGEHPSSDRLHRWGSTLAGAGKTPLGFKMMEDLQAQVLGKESYVVNGLRTEGVYLGTRDRHGDVIPEFVGARPEDIKGLMEGIFQYDERMKADKGMSPIVHAAGLAFGMVYVHPFEDGNGRIHRYLINHALTSRGAVPGTTVLPVSSVILDRIEEYDAVLKAHSAPLMAHIPWRQNEKSNVVVDVDTSDLYRYPDVTLQAEFLHSCVERTLDHDFPREIKYISSYDKAKRGINAVVDLPGKRLDDFIMFMNQNENAPGTLPKKRRKKEFGSIDDATIARLEQVVRDAFDIDDPEDEPAPPSP